MHYTPKLRTEPNFAGMILQTKTLKLAGLWAFLFLFLPSLHSQDSLDQQMIQSIYHTALLNSNTYPNLKSLCKDVGHRISGSPQAEKAVQLTKQMMERMHLDSVWLQPCMVPQWKRGAPERVQILQPMRKELTALALGYSAGTGGVELQGEVIEVQSLNAVDSLGEKVKGKIVFFNRRMDPTKIRTFEAYGGAVDQRVYGPARASKYGAKAALVRSMTTEIDDWAHTGVTIFKEGEVAIPACAISTQAAEELHQLLTRGSVKIGINLTCSQGPDVPSYNVIGELRGHEYPDEVIAVGGHLDSWDVGEGAHDDGAGTMQSIGTLDIFQKIQYRNKRTLRCIMFMNEENGLKGAKAYREWTGTSGEKHIAAIESDAGGFSPRELGFEAQDAIMPKVKQLMLSWDELFEPYGVQINQGGGGADIGPLRDLNTVLIGLEPDPQRYFDFHHTKRDNFEAVHKRELELGTACMTSIMYLLDRYGIQ